MTALGVAAKDRVDLFGGWKQCKDNQLSALRHGNAVEPDGW